MKNITALLIILCLTILFLAMNIKIRDDKIWKLQVENKDLKEQIHLLEKEKLIEKQ